MQDTMKSQLANMKTEKELSYMDPEERKAFFAGGGKQVSQEEKD